MSFSLSVALAALLSKWLYVSTLIRKFYQYTLKSSVIFIYILLPCNLGQRSVTISTLFLFILLVTSIRRGIDAVRIYILGLGFWG